MSVAELRRASSSLSEVAAQVRRSAERHGTQRSATQRAVTSIQEASRSPDARRLVSQGEVFIGQVAGTAEALGEVERTLRGLADQAGELATRLATLEREREGLLGSVWRAQATAYSPDMIPTARAEIDRLNGELRTVDRRIDGLCSAWQTACESAAAVVVRGEQALSGAHRAIARRRVREDTTAVSRTGLDAYGAAGATVQLGRSGVHVHGAIGTHRELRGLKAQLTTASDYLDERRLPRRTRREMMHRHNRPIQNRLPAARRAHHRSMTDLRRNRPLTQAGRALEGSSKYLRFVRGAGVAGIVSSGLGVVEAASVGDTERVITGSVTVVGSALMLVPGGAPVGAVLVAGAMIYENREAIVEGAKKAKDWVGDKVSTGLKKLNPFSKG